MNQEVVSKQKKIAYGIVATILFSLLLFVFYLCMQWLISAEEWVKLIRNVDHRMTTERFSDINSDSIRSPREASDIKKGDFNIVFLGDSFVHGFILQYKLAPPKQLENKLRKYFGRDNINVWNFGWTSSSPILQYRLLKDIGKKYKPNLVILSLDMTDYKDDYFYHHVLIGDGAYGYINRYPRIMYLVKKITGALDPYTGWHKRLFGYSAEKAYFITSEPLEENRILFDGVLDSLNQLHAYCRDELHVPFVVFIPPRHWQYTDKESLRSWEKGSYEVMGPYALENYRYFDGVRESTPYPLIPLLDEFKNSGVFPTTFEVDSHWNKHGAELMVDLVFNHLQKMGVLPSLQTDSLSSH